MVSKLPTRLVSLVSRQLLFEWDVSDWILAFKLEQANYKDNEPFPVIRRVEWALLFSNSRRPFQFTLQFPHDANSSTYNRSQIVTSRLWYLRPDTGLLYPNDHTRIPMLYSSQMPYLGYISRSLDDPPPLIKWICAMLHRVSNSAIATK